MKSRLYPYPSATQPVCPLELDCGTPKKPSLVTEAVWGDISPVVDVLSQKCGQKKHFPLSHSGCVVHLSPTCSSRFLSVNRRKMTLFSFISDSDVESGDKVTRDPEFLKMQMCIKQCQKHSQ